MKKANAVVVPVVFPATPAEKMAKLIDMMDYKLVSSYPDALKKFNESFANDPSYAIKWKGYDLMVEQQVDNYLTCFKNYRARTLTGPEKLEEFKQGLIQERDAIINRLISSSSMIEWDSSTSPMSNQYEKARNRAAQIAVETLKSMLNHIELYQTL